MDAVFLEMLVTVPVSPILLSVPFVLRMTLSPTELLDVLMLGALALLTLFSDSLPMSSPSRSASRCFISQSWFRRSRSVSDILGMYDFNLKRNNIRKHFELVSVPVVIKTMVSVRHGLRRCFGLHLDLN